MSTTKPWSCKSPTNQAALYALQIHNKLSISNQTACKSSHNISAHDCALKQSTTIQLTIVQRNINYQTMILQVSYKSSSIICTANTQLVQHFQPNSMQILSQYICAWLRSQSINTQFNWQLFKEISTTKPWSFKCPTTQAAVYLQQITQ